MIIITDSPPSPLSSSPLLSPLSSSLLSSPLSSSPLLSSLSLQPTSLIPTFYNAYHGMKPV
jgi:hypothetical protein